jgi:predicted aspartyl protease
LWRSAKHAIWLALAAALADAAVAADPGAAGCGTSRIGEITVATLHNAPIVTLSANGKPVTLLLDTGAEWTILTPAAAKRIGAQTPRIAFDRQMRGIGASLATNEVELRDFSAGRVEFPWRRVRVAPVNMPSVFSGPLDGVLGADMLSSFDVDLDLPQHRIVFYAKQSCAGARPAWAQPYAVIPARRSFSNHLAFTVLLDGRQIDAFIDAGAQLSLLSRRAAAALGVTEAALARDRATVTLGAAAERLNTRLHRFSRMEVGGELVRDPALIVADVSLKDADLILGIDFLGARRVWLSYGSQQIFLSHRG